MYLLRAQRLHTLNSKDESWPTMRKIREDRGLEIRRPVRHQEALSDRRRQDRARPLQRLLAGYGDATTKRRKRAGLK